MGRRHQRAQGSGFCDLCVEGSRSQLTPANLLAKSRTRTLFKSYPEGDIVNPSSISQQWVCQPKLSECFDGLWLHSVGLSCGCLVGTIVQNHYGDSRANKITPSKLLVYRPSKEEFTYASINPDGPAPTTTTVVEAPIEPIL